MSPSIKLTYFPIEGAAEPIRLALILAGVDFEDHRVKGPEWQELKPSTPYGQAPVMQIDGGPLRAQSGAMLRHVGATMSETLYPSAQLWDIEEALGVMGDLERAFFPSLMIGMRPQLFGYEDGFNKTEEGQAVVKKVREAFVQTELPKYLGFLESLMDRHGGGFLCGDKPTIADCFCIPNIRKFSRGFLDHIPAECLNDNPKIVEYIERFCALPQVEGRYTDGIGGSKKE